MIPQWWLLLHEWWLCGSCKYLFRNCTRKCPRCGALRWDRSRTMGIRQLVTMEYASGWSEQLDHMSI